MSFLLFLIGIGSGEKLILCTIYHTQILQLIMCFLLNYLVGFKIIGKETN